MSDITFHIEGTDKDDGDVQLSVFIDRLVAFRKLLNAADNIVSKKRKPTAYYKVVNLSHSSPAAITLAGEPIKKEDNNVDRTIDYVISGLRMIRTQKVAPSDATEGFINSANDLLGGLEQKKYTRMWIDSESNSGVTLDIDLAKALRGLLSGFVTSYGDVKGKVDVYVGHSEPFYFNLYPVFGGQPVKCIFKNDLKEQAANAINKTATISGELHFRPDKLLPFECVVKSIDIHPSDDELPTLSSLSGIAPDATGEMDTLEFIRSIREEWH